MKHNIIQSGWRILRCLTLAIFYLTAAHVSAGNEINLAGDWRFQFDPDDIGLTENWETTNLSGTIQLPNSTSTAGLGEPLKREVKLDQETMRHLYQRHSYIGAAWYQKTVDIPENWMQKDVILKLERVIWESRVWVNGVLVTNAQDSLVTPHRHDLIGLIKPGKNVLTIRVDNRMKYDIGSIGHAYTEETQSIWNGIVGEIKLLALEKLRPVHLMLYPDLKNKRVVCQVTIKNNSEKKINESGFMVVSDENGDLQSVPFTTSSIAEGVSSFAPTYEMGDDFKTWSEFSPHLYTMTVSIDGASISKVFAMREFKAEARTLTINGNPTFLRGTLECCIFPKTGHPPMDDAGWAHVFNTARSYGLNHLRFHSWCPPEAAFRMADKFGFYLQVELPNWSFSMGQKPEVDAFLRAEGERIIREYGHHPSFVMFSLGNELKGDLDSMDRLIAHFRKLAPQMLFTSTSYAFTKRGLLPGPEDNYFVSQRTQSGWVRGQGFLNSTKPNTASDYREGVSCLDIPLVTHEVGQYNGYPNLAEMPKYKGNLRPLGYEAIQTDLKKKGRLHEASRYTEASGKLALLLYKEDLERAMRTPDLSGIQLLDLHDFPGQSMATIGILDSFWESKGLVTPKTFREFCAPTVPLVRMEKMVFENSEALDCTVELAHFGEAPMKNQIVSWSLRNGKDSLANGSFDQKTIPLGNGIAIGKISHPLNTVAKPSKLTLRVSISDTDITNAWNIWVYPAKATPEPKSVQIFRQPSEDFFQALDLGKRVLLLPQQGTIRNSLAGRFIPVFWSPLHFPNQPGTLGAMFDNTHPVFAQFPTDSHTNWQWWELLANSSSIDMDTVPAHLDMPMRFVDKYNRNALPAGIFEAAVGTGKLLVCTLDIDSDIDTHIVARQLRRSILSYMAGDAFRPTGKLTQTALTNMFRQSYPTTANSAHSSYPASNATDGKPGTFWHNDWSAANKRFPFHLEIDLLKSKLIEGFAYTPRQDMNRGHARNYSIEVSQDGNKWIAYGKPGAFSAGKQKQTVRFAKPIKARHIRLVIHSGQEAEPIAAVAEFEPLINETTGDVRNLGIISGFND